MNKYDQYALQLTNKTAFLIGNGCSMSCGFPSGENLLFSAFLFIQEHYRNNNNLLFNNLASSIHSNLEQFFSDISDFRNLAIWGNLNGLHIPTFTQAFNIAISQNICNNNNCTYNCYSKTFRGKPFFKTNKNKDIKCKEIQDFLKNTHVWSLLEELNNKCADRNLYGSFNISDKRNRIDYFARTLSNIIIKILFYYYKNAKNKEIYNVFINNIKSKTTIINLNYDLLLENADKNKKLKIIKPHGSLDFVYRHNQTNKFEYGSEIGHNSYKLSKNNFERFFEGKILGNIEHLCVPYAETKHIKKFKVQNSILKHYVTEKIKELEKQLMKINKIVSIGYSFSENASKDGLIDKHIFELINSKKIYVVSKDRNNSNDIIRNVKKHYKNVKLYPTSFNGFNDYADNLCKNKIKTRKTKKDS